MSTNVPIASITLSAASPSVTFNGIPQTYTDLVLVISVLTNNTSADDVFLQFNSDTGSNYSQTGLRGNGSAASSARSSNQAQIFTTTVASAGSTTDPRTTIIQLMNYSNSTTNKTCIIRENIAGSQVAANVGLWRNTSAITTVLISTGSGFDFASGTTFNLYGINAANSGQAKATGGDTIIRDASYWYHVFYKSGTFTPTQSLSNVDYLVVAGGGAGGYRLGGGGGAGGLRASLSNSLTVNSNYSVLVGAGGTSAVENDTNGNDSSINGYVSTGGGRGGAGQAGTAGQPGGSGGGGTHSNTTPGAGNTPSTSPSQGNNGGNGSYAGGPYAFTGGGGGAGAVGGNGSTGTSISGSGGNGSDTYNGISLTSWFTATGTGSDGHMAGGGGGGVNATNGTRGIGRHGGGNGGGESNGTSATVNTGSGGGGGGNNGASTIGGNGGSGIVIVRYPV